MTRSLLQASVVIALALASTQAGAQTKQACADAYVAGQVARRESRLRDARAQFKVCAATACPAALQRDCKPWLEQLDQEIPTLAVTVTDVVGAPVLGAAVTVDGAPLAAPGPIALDPGEHVVRVEASGMTPTERRVTLAVGQRNRAFTLSLARSGGPAVASARPVPMAPIVLGASGLAALVVFAGVGAAGSAKKADLDALGCKPSCSPSDVSAARSLYLGADVSLGVGLAALVAAGVVLGVKLGAPAPAADAVSFSPSPGGGAFTFHF